jgi:transcriptional regulator with XRE-family HTH domain
MDDLNKLKRHLGAALLVARERAGLTQAEVSSQVGVVPAVYGRIERGGMMPSVPTFYRICVALGLSANTVLGLGSEPLLIASPTSPPPDEDAPELRRLARLLPALSPEALRCMSAIATAFADKRSENEEKLKNKSEKRSRSQKKGERRNGEEEEAPSQSSA